jgi:hypothetical protein
MGLLWLAIGVFVGVFLGVCVMCLLQMARER